MVTIEITILAFMGAAISMLWLGINTKLTALRMLFFTIGLGFFMITFAVAGTFFASYVIPAGYWANTIITGVPACTGTICTNDIEGSNTFIATPQGPYLTQANINALSGISFGAAYITGVMLVVYLILEVVLYFFNIILTPAGIKIKRRNFTDTEDS